MNNPAAPGSGISASLGQATGYQTENFKRPKGRGIKPLDGEHEEGILHAMQHGKGCEDDIFHNGEYRLCR